MLPESQLTSANRQLVLICQPCLLLAWSAGDPGDAISVGSLRYGSIVDSDFTAFYDRILDHSSRLIGFEIFLLAGGEEIMDRLLMLPYARPGRSKVSIQLYLDMPASDDPAIEVDQAFGGRIYEAVTGAIAISIDTGWLSDFEQESIISANVNWTNLE